MGENPTSSNQTRTQGLSDRVENGQALFRLRPNLSAFRHGLRPQRWRSEERQPTAPKVWEELFKRPATTSPSAVNVAWLEWCAEIDTRVAALRANVSGAGQPLTRLNAQGLAGNWYVWFLKQHENDPRGAERWAHGVQSRHSRSRVSVWKRPQTVSRCGRAMRTVNSRASLLGLHRRIDDSDTGALGAS